MTVRCVEPAAAVPGGNQFLVNVPANDELLFPHVDSCIAIAFVLGDGRISIDNRALVFQRAYREIAGNQTKRLG